MSLSPEPLPALPQNGSPVGAGPRAPHKFFRCFKREAWHLSGSDLPDQIVPCPVLKSTSGGTPITFAIESHRSQVLFLTYTDQDSIL